MLSPFLVPQEVVLPGHCAVVGKQVSIGIPSFWWGRVHALVVVSKSHSVGDVAEVIHHHTQLLRSLWTLHPQYGGMPKYSLLPLAKKAALFSLEKYVGSPKMQMQYWSLPTLWL
jgi:hypothetical protein